MLRPPFDLKLENQFRLRFASGGAGLDINVKKGGSAMIRIGDSVPSDVET